MSFPNNIASKSELLQAIENWKDSDSFNRRLIGFQFSLSIEDYKLPILCDRDFQPVVSDLLNDLHCGDCTGASGDRLPTGYHKEWRHYGADFIDGQYGVDQIDLVVEVLRKTFDRRILLVAWNPMAPEACGLTHCLMQFYLSEGRLSSKLYQSHGRLSRVMRYDSAKAVLLTYILCRVIGASPGQFIHSFGELECDTESISGDIDAAFATVALTGDCAHIDDIGATNICLQSGDESEQFLVEHSGPCGRPLDRHEEFQYLDLVRRIIGGGARFTDRTGVGTISVFGPQMAFSLRDGRLPLLTTKHVFHRIVIEELLWFVRGCTDGNELAKRNVHIWDANGTEQFLSNVGLGHRQPGDLGPIYGFQWRHFGARYVDKFTDYSGQGVDQIARLIHSIKTNPGGQNHIVMAWNPKDLRLMALPPCHCLVQFFVEGDELSCKLYQRSGDMGLGVPFNIASYALLTHMIAHVTGLRPGHFIHTLGDAHVYLNHIDALRVQIGREPRDFPTLKFQRQISDIEDFQFSDFIVENYHPHPKIPMEMAV